MPSVSVIIPTFNRAKKVVRAISSVLYQTFLDYEIIVVDDGSTDETKTVISQLASHITYVTNIHNLGVSASRNIGIRKSRSQLIAFLDSDDYWLPEKLAVQVDFFERYPDALICQTEEIWIRKGRRVNPKKYHLKPTGNIFGPSLRRCFISPSAVMLKRSLFDEIGMFDEGLPACEDYDMWLRITCRHPVYLIKQYHVVKEGGNTDQLSFRYKGMDRFRIKAIVKLIKSGMLTENQLKDAVKELSFKCKIYGNGCIKRGKKKEGEYYLTLPKTINKELSACYAF